METIAELEVQEIAWPEQTFVCKRLIVAQEKLNVTLNKNFRFIYQTLQDRAIEAEFPPFAIYYSRDEARGLVELAAAIPVEDELKNLDEFEILTLPASTAIVINHYGSYEDLRVPYNILEKYMRERGYKRTWTLEQYYTDSTVVKDPAKWKTSIYFLLRED